MIPVTISQIENSIIPVSRFNKGEASKIFKEVQRDGVKAVFKNNRREAVIMSPEMYDQLIMLLEDQLLYEEAVKRLAKPGKTYSIKESMDRLGITAAMLEDVDEEELEIE